MGNVYSTLFAASPGFSGGPTTVYTVPDGFVAAVRMISIVHGDVLGSGLDAWVQRSNLSKLARSTINIGLSPQPNWYGGTDVYWGLWVLEVGDELQLQTAAGTVDFEVHGHLLSLP